MNVFRDLIPDAVRVAAVSPQLRFKVVRVQPKTRYRLVVRCEAALVLATHFVRRRSWPCLGKDCPGCKHTAPRRFAYFVATIHDVANEVPFVLEVPGATLEALRKDIEALADFGSRGLLGLVMEFVREKDTIRSRVLGRWFERLDVCSLGDLSDITRVVFRMLSLPCYEHGNDLEAWVEQIRPIMLNRM